MVEKKVRRLFVEKKKGYDVEARGLFLDLVNNLGIKGLTKILIVNRYDIEGITEPQYQAAKGIILSEPPVDQAYDEEYPLSGKRYFAIEYLPGQYDQRADSTEQCIQLLTLSDRPVVRTARIVIIEGEISDNSFELIKNYCINPVESREALFGKPESLNIMMLYPENVEVVDGFIEWVDNKLLDFYKNRGFAMSVADLLFCRDYFRDTQRRNPTITELKVLDTYWSDHCRHTTFLTKIDNVQFDDGFFMKPILDSYKMYLKCRKKLYYAKEKDMCLMDLATIAMKELKKEGKIPDLDESDEINACSIRIDVDIDGKIEPWLVMFKNETHNHPTEIEPFGGAATCLGGAIRDPLSGRSFVYQAMRITGSGDPRTKIEDTIPGKLPQRKITTGAASGYSSYGNQIGLCTGQVVEIYNEGYIAKRMEIGAVVGAVPAENVRREKPKPGDVVILLGGRTGRDGCGGATGSSKEHNEESLFNCGAEVQKGNAPTERKIQRLFRDPKVTSLIKKCNDFGAGGVSVAIGELADGLEIDLDTIPKKYEGLDGTELAISESQERMAVVIDKSDVDEFILRARNENLEAVCVAVVTEEPRLKMTWRGSTIVDISREFLDTNGVTQYASAKVTNPDSEGFFEKYKKQPMAISQQGTRNDRRLTKDLCYKLLSDLNICSQKGLVERFDSSIGAGTIHMPYGGKYQLSPEDSMIAKIPVLNGETGTGTIMTFGFNPEIFGWSPFHGAVYAIVEAVSKIVVSGGNYKLVRLTLQEYFEKLGKDSSKWGKPFSALLGAFYAQTMFELPAIGGKDSMSGTFKDISVPPTLVAFAISPCRVSETVSGVFSNAGTKAYLLKAKYDESNLPDFAYLKNLYSRVHELMALGKIKSARAIRSGGLLEAVAKMSFGNMLGFDYEKIEVEDLFYPAYGSILVELENIEENVDSQLSITSMFKDLETQLIGKVSDKKVITIGSIEIELNEMVKCWTRTLEDVFPSSAVEPQIFDTQYRFIRREDNNSANNDNKDLNNNTNNLKDDMNDNIGYNQNNMNDYEKNDLSHNQNNMNDYGKNDLNHNQNNMNSNSIKINKDMTQIANNTNLKKDNKANIKLAKPRIFIPVFPGTNCEYDTARAFRNAGGEAEIFVVNNMNAQSLEESVREMAKSIANSQIIAIPGGFSGGDEPDGSGKFIATTFRNKYVRDAVMELIKNRDGLIIGICNGFQALIKLGLVPYGEITDIDENSPTLTYNNIGRHVSLMVQTKIVSNLSPWFAKASLGEIHTIPVSHGEGRFVANEDVLATLIKNGQIATQYVDFDGKPTGNVCFNPNGSVFAIEGITSPCGRILGKMGHSERVGDFVCKNVPGNKEQRLFEAGIDYFA